MALPNKQSYGQLGGELQDYSPVTDPTTDLSAFASNELRVDVSALTRTADISTLVFHWTGTDIVIDEFEAVFGNSIQFQPTVTRIGAGTYRATFPASVVDARGITRFINLSKACYANCEQAGFVISVRKNSGVVIDISAFDTQAQTLADPPSPAAICLFVKSLT